MNKKADARPRYGIEVGQVYAARDGRKPAVTVEGVENLDKGAVTAREAGAGRLRNIPAYVLAEEGYYLTDFATGDSKAKLLQQLEEGEASPEQQKHVAELFKALQSLVEYQKVEARRGRLLVESGQWRRLETEEGLQTWLALEVEPGADLSSVGSREDAVDRLLNSPKGPGGA